jgi:hypothetical protein
VRRYKFLIGLIFLVSLPVWASNPKADAITTDFLSLKKGFTGDQTNFSGLMRLLKKHVFEDEVTGFTMSNALHEFQPYTVAQSDELIQTVLEMGTVNHRLLQPEVLFSFLFHQQISKKGLALLTRLFTTTPNPVLQRTLARILIEQDPSDVSARNQLWAIAKPALTAHAKDASQVEVFRVLALLDLLYSSDRAKALELVIVLANNEPALQVLIVYLAGAYAEAAGSDFMLRLANHLVVNNPVGAEHFLTVLHHYQPKMFIRIADQIEDVNCYRLLMSAYSLLDQRSGHAATIQ